MIKNVKCLILALALSVLLAFSFCLTACGPEENPPAHKHSLQKVSAVAPTCTETGNVEYRKCTDCGKYFEDAAGTKEIADKTTVVIAAKGHSTAKTDAKAATCTEAGNKEYWICGGCDVIFADSEAKTPTTAADVTIAATGHTPSGEWTNDGLHHWKDCTAGHKIEKDKDLHTLSMTLAGGKREYLRYEALDTDEMTAAVECSVCAFAKSVPVTAAMVSGYDPAVTGKQTLTVTYRGAADDANTEVTATYDVTVAETAVTYAVTLENAWFGDETSTKELAHGGGLPAGLKSVDGNTLTGWYDRTGDKYYGKDEFKASGAVTLTAVYAEDLARSFTPDCVIENKASGGQTTMTHEIVGGINATTFAIDGGIAAGEVYKILNNDTYVPHPDNCNNDYPLSAEHGSLALMTFRNNGDTAVKFAYQVEYFGVIGEVALDLAAGETKEVPLLTPKAKSDTVSPFHQLAFPDAVDGGVSLTVFGKIYTYTDYASRLNAHALKLHGATFADGADIAYFEFEATGALNGAVLDADKTFLGWADASNTLFAADEFTMPAEDTVLSAVYKEDLNAFTPSCCFENMSGGAKTTMEHTAAGDVKATVFAKADGVAAGEGYKILNNDGTRPDNCENLFPIYGDRGSFALMTFVNNGTTELKFKYQAEYWGIRGEVAVTVPAGGTIEAMMICSKAADKSDAPSAFNQLVFTEAAVGEISLKIYGGTYDPRLLQRARGRLIKRRKDIYGST